MWSRQQRVIRVEVSPDKLAQAVGILIGPGGAIAALLLFIAYLMRETSGARKERDEYQKKYEGMREQRDEFRFLAGDAIRAGKRSTQTAASLARHRSHDKDNDS